MWLFYDATLAPLITVRAAERGAWRHRWFSENIVNVRIIVIYACLLILAVQGPKGGYSRGENMSGYLLRQTLLAAAVLYCLTPPLACAGGIRLGSTRAIYSDTQKQIGLAVRNTSDRQPFFVQSWVEGADGHKTQDFRVTPPLYLSEPGKANTLRLTYVGRPAKQNEETLYYFRSRAIPALSKKETEGRDLLLLAAVTRIKLFLRPAGLTPAVDDAPAQLSFHRSGNAVRIDNPTPYHITLTQINSGGEPLEDVMVNPHASATVALPSAASSSVSFHTINDAGAITPQKQAALLSDLSGKR